jgi:hypothetical protein
VATETAVPAPASPGAVAVASPPSPGCRVVATEAGTTPKSVTTTAVRNAKRAPGADRRVRVTLPTTCADLLSAPRLAIPYVPTTGMNQVDQLWRPARTIGHEQLRRYV